MSQETIFRAYFNRYYTALGMYVMRFCENADEAEDIVQETFSRAWQRFAEDELPEKPKSYLYRIAHNITIDHLRKRKPQEASVSIEELSEIEISEEAIDTSERDARLWIAISKLPNRCREVFLLSKRDGLTHAEIAEELGISIKTVENQITKALKTLRDILEPSNVKVFFLPFL
ncbi:MAG: RNA polymerase sigma-70 factor [Muribaculaceae bacterium]|nr:RNA polymerase sigma-70 factor [Muribaculaceae bacterium]